MIAAQLEKSKAIETRLSALPECSRFPPELEMLCRALLTTVMDPQFPGALIPGTFADQGIQVIATATPSDWRRLSPVLQAFAGPTLTSFNGLPIQLPESHPIASALQELNTQPISVIALPHDVKGQQIALRALTRARETFARAPRLTKSAPEPTSWLLAQFQDHLNVGRRDAAIGLLDRLREELRLDALNLKALQIQLFATFNDWAAITKIQGFANLTVARRTPTVTGLLLEALYQVHLATDFDTADEETVGRSYAETVRPLALPMLTLPVPASLSDGGWRLYGLEALVAPERKELRTVLQPKLSVLGWLAQRLPMTHVDSVSEVDPLDRARELVVANEASESVDVLAAAVAAISRLTVEQRAELARAEPFSSAFRIVQQESVESEPPTSWLLWLARLSDPAFTNALEVARFGAEEWPLSSESPDPTEIRTLVDSLGAAQADELAAERTAQALPFLVAAIRRDPGFPSPALAPVYSSLLTLLALGSTRGVSTYDSSQVLIEGLLAIGLNARDYRALIDDVGELAGEGFGVEMIFWTLEVIEAFMRHAAPDAEARESLMHRLLARIVAIKMRLSTLQLAAVKRLVVEFGWSSEGLETAENQTGQDSFALRLSDKKVAIYSLLEAASRHAKFVLEAAVPGISVDCNADFGGTSRLRALAQNSDIFIIVWTAAKHAATDFIREHRGTRTLLYAQGKGFSSLLRALEDHFKLSG
jgi:hypothetical protein